MIWENLANSQLIENLGWTLLHSIWQIGFLAFWLFFTLRTLAKSSANSRYLFSLFALVLSFILPVMTFVWLSNDSAQPMQNFTNSDMKNTAIFELKPQPTEDFSLNKTVKIPDTKDKNFFVSIEDLQNDFAASFSLLSPFLVGCWLLGMLLFAFRFVGGIRQLHIYKTRETLAPDRDWQENFSALRKKLKIKQTVKFLQSKIIETPMVIGCLKPIILIPASVFLQINPRELETIIAHELVHIRRYDYLVNFAQNITEILFFYHPAIWWISAQTRIERECACDDAVVQTLENSQVVYANALANLEELRQTARATTPSILVAANGGKLMKRIERIIRQKNTKKSVAKNSLWSASFASALILALMLGIFSATTNLSVNAQKSLNVGKEKKIAVGFVSIPPVDRTENPPKDSEATARLLIEKLKAHRVPAIGFLQGAMISDGEKLFPVRANIVRLWRDAGFEIGIGNFKHVWFYDTPYDEYVGGVEKNEAVARRILAEKNLPLRYFSYPFLNTGKNADDRNRFEAWLQTRGLSAVKYTIDNQEWMYSYAYDMARNDNDINTMNEIRAEFLGYMTKMFDHYEAYSSEMFRRDINQTLVLTTSRLIADSADELFGMIENRGYRFVPIDEAQADEAYRTPENFYGKAGVSWFERWQLAQGKKLRAEPKVSKSVEDTWDYRKNKNAPLPPKPPAPPTPPPPNKK
jgi:beta-lactamase regulating signal transducer with metallopeptidase domain